MLKKGSVLNNRYRIEGLLGQGGMGAVYYAFDISLGIFVAVKENFDTSPEAHKQFQHEARILARLAHPNLPRVIDYFFLPGQGQYLVMDFVDGVSLEHFLNQQDSLSEAQVLPWIDQICSALIYLHRQSPPIIHRDIKPANIKIRSDGVAILVDFGIAKVFNPHLATTLGAKAVTPGYSPPEQYSNSTTDARSDIYALGATLYHLLTGKKPPESIQRVVADAIVLSPRQLNPRISGNVEHVIVKAIAISIRNRYQSVEEIRKDIGWAPKRHSSPRQIVANSPKPKQNTSEKITQENQLIIGVLLLVTLILVIFASVLLLRHKGDTALPLDATIEHVATDVFVTAAPAMVDVPSTPFHNNTPSTPVKNFILPEIADSYQGEAVSLNWNYPIENESSYRLVIQGNGEKIDELLGENSYTAENLPAGAYAWMVLVVNSDGVEVARSNQAQFTVKAQPTATSIPATLPHNTGSATATSKPAGPNKGATLPAPMLQKPNNGASFASKQDEVSFEWSAAPRNLGANEYYVLVIEHSAGIDYTWLKTNNYNMPDDKRWLFDKNQDRDLSWHVVVAYKRNPNDDNENPAGAEVSAPSETRQFRWGSSGGGGGAPAPTPTPSRG